MTVIRYFMSMLNNGQSGFDAYDPYGPAPHAIPNSKLFGKK